MAKGTFSLSNIQVGGRVGDLVFLPQSNGRVVVRRMPTDLPPRTALQDQSAARMTVVGAAWRALSSEDAEAWDRYVEAARGWPLPTGGKAPTQGYGAFLGLSAKCLQMRPGAPVPARPPETPFLGDGIGVTVSGPLPPTSTILNPLPYGCPFHSFLAPRGTISDLLLDRAKRAGGGNGAFAPADEGGASEADREGLPDAGVRRVFGGRVGGDRAV